MTPGLYQPLPPTTFVVDKALSHCVRLVPVEIPDKMCGCSSESLRLSPGKTVAVITMNGRYDLSMPVLSWAAGVVDLNRSDYWPATLHFATIYATDVFFSFEEMKMAAPGLSEEQAIFEDVFIAKDEDVTRFVDYIHKTSKHVKSQTIRLYTGLHLPPTEESVEEVFVEGSGQQPERPPKDLPARTHRHADSHGHALESAKVQQFGHRTDPSLSEDHKSSAKPVAKPRVYESRTGSDREPLEDWISDVKEWADAATTTTTNDVDALASRIEVLVASIKRRSYKDTDGNKGRARIRRKIREEKGILTSVVEKYNRMVPNTETILSGETAWPWQLTHSDSVDLRTKRKAFNIIMSLRRLQEEQKILVAEMDNHWKYLSTRAGTLRELSCLFASETLKNSQCGLSEEGLKGLQSIIHRKQRKIREMRVQARDCYLQVLSGAENNLLNKLSADDYDSDFEISDDEL
ncbi:uncharacterized protein LOC131544180 [Onychostoma macrolepis]|uniref:uncharacterized protein LOC131544180 n=1 Tax=Onychostoma macrolepis TaxID=369639 RepID=UPI00272D3AFD|nr:uncharacterized protein LOC131544180 [Onychostoma macrolepis]